MGASSAERGGSAQAYGRSAEIALENAGTSKRQRRPRCYRYGVHTDHGPIALQAFWGMHVEAMNFSGMGHAGYATALDLSPHSLRIWRDRLEQSGNEMDWQSLLHPSARAQLSSAANCMWRKCRLVSGGRPVKPAPLQRRAKAGDDAGDREADAAVAVVCRRHGMATNQLFRWRVQFGLTARKMPQLATVALADGAAN